jgi:hypothetical protein
VRLAQADQPQRRCNAQDRGIARRHPPGQQRAARLRGHPGAVDIVLPADGDTIQHGPTLAQPGASAGGPGLGAGPVGRGSGKDPVAVGAGLYRGKECVGQLARIDRSRRDRPTEVGRALVAHILHVAP